MNNEDLILETPEARNSYRARVEELVKGLSDEEKGHFVEIHGGYPYEDDTYGYTVSIKKFDGHSRYDILSQVVNENLIPALEELTGKVNNESGQIPKLSP